MTRHLKLTTDQERYLEFIRANSKHDDDVVVVPHVYGPGKNTLHSMEKRGILTVLNKNKWRETCEAKVKLSPQWCKKAAPQQLEITLKLTLDEHDALLRYLSDAKALVNIKVKRQHPDAVRELFKESDRIKALVKKIRGQVKKK
jgi:hypothetical protein